jgi:hypothetical protein
MEEEEEEEEKVLQMDVCSHVMCYEQNVIQVSTL